MSKEPTGGGGRVNEFWQEKYRREAGKNWNLFYKRNETRFFKDRHWIGREFPELYEPQIKNVLEVGCGVGNFALPLVQDNPNICVYGCDFAAKAIELLRNDPRYASASGRCIGFVADLTLPDSLAASIPPHSVDIVTCIFVLSALPPEKFKTAIQNIKAVLRPGGMVLFRDYSLQDAALQRFNNDRRLGEYLCVRQDGTLAYYFGEEELNQLFSQEGFSIQESTLIHSKTSNVKRELNLDRYFLQGKYRLDL